jgi:hypothetical protein
MFTNHDLNASMGAADGNEDDKDKKKKVKIPFYQLTQDERIHFFRLKSAKIEKKR